MFTPILTVKKGTILWTRSGLRWNDVFGDPVAIAQASTRMRRPHRHTTTPAPRAFLWDHAHLGSHPAQRACGRNHAPLVARLTERACSRTGFHTTPCITGNPHNGPSYHAGTTGVCTPEGAQRAFGKREPLHTYQKGMAITLPRVPNGLRISRRRGAPHGIASKCQ